MDLEELPNGRATSDNIQVVLRVRPLNDREVKLGGKKCVEMSASTDSQILLDTTNSRSSSGNTAMAGSSKPGEPSFLSKSTFLSTSMLNLPPEPKAFEFDWVAGENSNQFEMFQKIGVPMADACLQGYNCTVCAYGQTGAGKTYTMQGRGITLADIQSQNLHSDIHTGLQTRVLDYLFRKTGESKLPTLIKCAYIEIYNESIKDLLNPSSGSLQLRENVQKGVFIEKVTEEVVKSSSDVLTLLARGMRNRHIGSTNMNDESSRSHTVLTVSFESQRLTKGVQKLVSSKLHFVDLAGSERQKKTNTQGDQLKEAAKINQSLSTLGEVINTLANAKSKKVHIKYRNSKLTYLLRDSLGGNSKTTIIANISPAADNYSETLSTLQFAQRAKTIQNKASINEETAGDFENLKAENGLLKDKVTELQVLLKDIQEKSAANLQAKQPAQIPTDEYELLMEINRTSLEAEKQAFEFEEELKDLNQRLKYEYLKREEFKELFDRACEAGTQQECSLKLMVRLMQQRESRLRDHSWDYDSEVSFLKQQVQALEASVKLQPVVMQVFQENLQLKQQIVYANVDGKPNPNILRVMNLLRGNLTFLEGFSAKLEKNIEDRQKLAKRFEKLRLMQGGTSDQFCQVFTEEENEELKQKLEALTMQLMSRTQLEEQLRKTIDQQKAQLVEEQQEHEKTRSDLKAEIKSLEDRITELNHSYAEIQQSGQETNSRFAVQEVELKDKIIGLELKKSELLKKLDRSEQRNAEDRRMFEEKVTQQHQRTQQLNLDIMRLNEEMNIKKQGLSKLKEENGVLKSENQSLLVRLNKKTEENASLTQCVQQKEQEMLSRRTEFEQEVFSLKNQVEASQNEAEEYRMENDSLGQKIDLLQQEIDSLNESNLYMKELAETRASQVISLQEQLQFIRKEDNMQVSAQLDEMVKKLQVSDESVQYLQKQLFEVRQSESDFRSAYFESKSEIERTYSRLTETLEMVKTKEQEAEELKAQIQQLILDGEEDKKELQQAQNQVGRMTDEKEIVQMVNKTLEGQLKEQNLKSKKLEDEVRAANDKIAKLQMNLITVQQQSESTVENLQLQMRSINEQNKILISEKNDKEAEFDKLLETSQQQITELNNQLKESKFKCSSLQASSIECVEMEDLTSQGAMLAQSHQHELRLKQEHIERLQFDLRQKKQLLAEHQRKYGDLKKKSEDELSQIKSNFKRLTTEVHVIKDHYDTLIQENNRLKAEMNGQNDSVKLVEQKLLSKDFDLNRLSSYAERVSEKNEILELEVEGLKRVKNKIMKYVKEHEHTKDGVSAHDINILAVHIESETASHIKSKQKEHKASKPKNEGSNHASTLAENLTLYTDEKEVLQQILQVLDELKLVENNKNWGQTSDCEDFDTRLDLGNSSAKKKRKDDTGILKVLQRFYQRVLAFKAISQEQYFKLKSYDILAVKLAKLENEMDRLIQRGGLGDSTNINKFHSSVLMTNRKPQYTGKENQPKDKRSARKEKMMNGSQSGTALKKRDASYVGIIDSSEASVNEDEDVICMGGAAGGLLKKTHSRRLKAHENQKRAAMMQVNGQGDRFDSNAPTPKKF